MTESKYVAENIKNIKPSGIRKFFDVVTEMKGAISLGVGEPDFPTPWHIREEAVYILEKGKTTYTSNAGLLELREQISAYMQRKFNLNYKAESQVVVTVGASEGIDISLRAITNPGDEILVVEPSYVSYVPCIAMAGGVPVIITTKAENEFKLTADELKKCITPKTKAIILPYPNNPTGAIMDKDDLKDIVEVLKDKDIIVISDEIYAELTYGQDHVSVASFAEMYDKTIVINGFSKAYSMTGWRIGYACGPEDIISAMIKIHQFIIMCAPTMSQYAGIDALKNGDADVQVMRNDYDERRRYILKGFRSMGLSCFEPKGAFYVFPSIQSTGMSSEEFATKLLYAEKVAVVPGTAFGDCGEGFVRCSYAYSIKNIKEALKRISRFMEQFES